MLLAAAAVRLALSCRATGLLSFWALQWQTAATNRGGPFDAACGCCGNSKTCSSPTSQHAWPGNLLRMQSILLQLEQQPKHCSQCNCHYASTVGAIPDPQHPTTAPGLAPCTYLACTENLRATGRATTAAKTKSRAEVSRLPCPQACTAAKQPLSAVTWTCSCLACTQHWGSGLSTHCNTRHLDCLAWSFSRRPGSKGWVG
jgi:hypothetical protein